MNQGQNVGAAKQVTGSIKEAIGKVTGDAKIETEGAAEKDAGKAQNTLDDAKGGIRQAAAE